MTSPASLASAEGCWGTCCSYYILILIVRPRLLASVCFCNCFFLNSAFFSFRPLPCVCFLVFFSVASNFKIQFFKTTFFNSNLLAYEHKFIKLKLPEYFWMAGYTSTLLIFYIYQHNIISIYKYILVVVFVVIVLLVLLLIVCVTILSLFYSFSFFVAHFFYWHSLSFLDGQTIKNKDLFKNMAHHWELKDILRD